MDKTDYIIIIIILASVASFIFMASLLVDIVVDIAVNTDWKQLIVDSGRWVSDVVEEIKESND